MPREGKKETGEQVGRVNLTPMIDVVFQLIIFFMLVSELTNLALEPVILPWGDHAQEAKLPGEVVVNIKRLDGKAGKRAAVVIAGEEIPGEGQQLIKNLTARLQLEAEAYGEWTPLPQNPNRRVSELDLRVRMDREVPSEYFHYLMWACNDVGIYKVYVSVKERIQ